MLRVDDVVGLDVVHLEERRGERDELEAERVRLLDENEDLREQIADLDAVVQELRSAFESTAEHVEQLASTFNVDVASFGAALEDVDVEASPEPSAPEQPTAVRDQLMTEFQQDAIDRIMASLEGMSDREQKLLRYIESRGRPIRSQKAWGKQALGLAGNPAGTHFEAMKGVIESGFVRKNKDGSITPTIRERVEEELDGYDVDRTTIGDTHERVLARLAV